MITIIDTINDTLFKHRETLKNLNEEQEELLLKLCSKRQTIGQIKDKVGKLEAELKALYNSTYGAGDRIGSEKLSASVSERHPDYDNSMKKRQE